jgi:hypothetical protein
MLAKIFGSRSRVKLLKLFLLNPCGKYYIRQLAREQGLQLNSIRRELDNLEKFGILTSLPAESIKGEDANKKISSEENSKEIPKREDKKYYRANPNFILFEELRALVIKAQVLYEKKFIEKAKKIGRVQLLILCGLFVNDEKSSVDLLIVGKPVKEKFSALIKELEEELGREINYTLMDAEEFKYRKDITDIFLYTILEGKNIKIIDEIL